MDAQLKKKWIEALRSGEYQQGVGALQRENSFCCLGVLCDISHAGKWERLSDGSIGYVFGADDDSDVVPSQLRVNIGLTVEEQRHLYVRNDRGSSFAELADYIETHIPAGPSAPPSQEHQEAGR